MSTRLVIIGGSDAGISAGLRAKDVPEKGKGPERKHRPQTNSRDALLVCL